METETIETPAHITDDGTLNLSVKVGLANTDVAVVLHVNLRSALPGNDRVPGLKSVDW